MWWSALSILMIGCGRLGFDVTSDDAPGTPDVSSLPANLVSWFPFEDLVDQVSNLEATCEAARCPVKVPGRVGMAAEFDGVDDCLIVANTAAFALATITIALWVRPAGSQPMSPIAKRFGGDADSWQIETETAGTLDALTFSTALTATGNDFLSTPDGSRSSGVFQHYAASWDGATKRVYIDGVELAAVSLPQTMLLYDDNPVLIGCDDNSGTLVIPYEGVIDEVQIYDRALSTQEIVGIAMQ